jgi:hypothetical protein
LYWLPTERNNYQRLPNETPTFGATLGPWDIKKLRATPPNMETEKFRLVKNFAPTAKPIPSSVKGFNIWVE